MKNSKKLVSILLALVLVFSISAVAFADWTYPQTSTGTVTVMFTTGCSTNNNGTNTWNGYDEDVNYLLDGDDVTIESLNNCSKPYVPNGVTNPMGNTPSVMDAILASQPNYDFDYDWDYSPWSGPQGAYIHNVENQTLASNYTEIGGVHHSWGTGFVVILEYPNGQNDPIMVFPSEYVSNVPLADGMTIYVDLSAYDYTW